METTTFRNYTPHTIRVERPDGEEGLVLPSLGVVRVTEEQSVHSTVGWIELRKTLYKEITDLPEPEKDVLYIVSIVVAQANLRAAQPRTDLICPDTGPSCLRGENGQIRAITGFVVY